MNRSCYEATIDKSCEARVVAYSKHNYALSFWNSTLMKSLLASFPFSNGLGTSLQLSRVKNSVIAIGRMWFLYFKRRLLTQHISEFLQVTPGPFPNFGWGLGTRLIKHTFCRSKILIPITNKCFNRWHTSDYLSVQWLIVLKMLRPFLSCKGCGQGKPAALTFREHLGVQLLCS